MIRFTITGTKPDIEIMTAAAMVIADPETMVNVSDDASGNVNVEGVVHQTLRRKEAYAKLLEGITYREWEKLSMAMNAYFDGEKRKRENEIQLARAEDVEKIIRRQFG